MGRRKQSKPQRSGGLVIEETDQESHRKQKKEKKNVEHIDKPYYVNISRVSEEEEQHQFDVAEVVLTNFSLRDGGSSIEIDQDLDCSLRFRLCNVSSFVDRIKLGHWPVLSSSDVTLELVDKKVGDDEGGSVIWSASFDGPGEGVSGLAHLASIKFLSLRLVPGDQGLLSPRVRVELLQQAFDACESLLENTRQIWKKSMVNVMSWLRPEVMTSEVRYGTQVNAEENDSSVVTEAETLESSKQSTFDATAFYEAIKPSKMDAMLEDDIPDLLPELRPYQRRAAYWMVQRERGDPIQLGLKEDNQFISPLSISVGFLDSASKMFFNPFSGNISLAPEYFSPQIPGGILADEMGLGKTVELLACIFSHRKPAEDDILMSDINVSSSVTDDGKTGLKRLKRERVECVCGAVSESRKYKGVWVQCDLCDAWQHADCVGYSPKGKSKKASQDVDEKVSQKKRKKDAVEIVVRQGEYTCQMCSELLQVTASPISTGATLIVCPAPILPQWHSEITRHTRLGSLKTCIYEGVRNASLSEEPVVDITELLNADIVLTTYDVLKEDLTHDHDRHDGDRHCLRFQKRYPVIPTPLTRIFWWRICLDEAQMVESNAAAATEMALRLYTKNRWCITGTPIQRKLDDLFGLLRFLKANPFDVSRWWTEVIREPYERRDAKAMEFTHRFFKQVMWRSSKVHVADELQLPPQEECISWLRFSAIEEHFYSRQHETCVSYAREVIETLKCDILKRGHTSSDNLLITHAEASKLLNSLLKLRQACCHPQVGSSGLRSLQQTPMTMEEILMVLVKKTQNEGEEALRMLIVALNGIAAIALLKQEFSEAVSLYKEALNISEEHTEDFRLDPLLHIHILHNLVEILPLVESYRGTKSASGSPKTEIDVNDDDDHRAAKRQKINEPDNLDHVSSETAQERGSNVPDPGLKKDGECHEECKTLDIVCDTLKVKYLSAFNSKHSAAQQEFRKSHSQVTESLRGMEKQSSVWWLDALQLAEQNKDFSSGLTRKIEETIHGSSSRETSRFKTIHGMKLHLQTCVDMLERSRKKVLDKLLEIDQTMENPKLEHIELIGNCKNCKLKDEGPMCTHCELDELFKEYEARLFRINKSRGATMELASAEEILDLQKKNSARNLFFTGLSSRKSDLNAPHGDNKEPTKRGEYVDRVVRSASPSETEIVLGVIRNHCKTYLDREGKLAATKHLHTLEVMRKEYAHARLLARTQAHILRAYDEIKMATMRLQLRESEDDTSIYALSLDELDAASVHNTNDKFLAQSSLLSIKGKLRYLKGLIQAKQKEESESPDHSLLIEEQSVKASASVEQNGENNLKPEEACPICHENLRNQKMVFQCGHSTCCKCFFAMTERRSFPESQQKWVMCPICRQHTDVRNIAYADDRRNCSSSDQVYKENEASLAVQGSYGTKIEAVTRRILWIKSSDPKAKVLVFSSWKDVLDVLEHAFAANGITFIRMKGGRKSQTAISKFKETDQKEAKSIQVLLLLVQHGANGLNLLEAQHVVLVEPLLNPAAEAQAVGRVHRIGQEKPTLVHRFLVTSTVEESIYKLNRSKNTNVSSFSNRKTKNQDQESLTLKDLESLFTSPAAEATETKENMEEAQENLRDLHPSVAAAIAAERRMKESCASSSTANAS